MAKKNEGWLCLPEASRDDPRRASCWLSLSFPMRVKNAVLELSVSRLVSDSIMLS
jgi:hypothetical protein